MDKYIELSKYAEQRLSPAVDIVIMALCLVLYILLFQSYITRNYMLKRIQRAVVYSYCSMGASLIGNVLMTRHPEQHMLIYAVRIIYYVLIEANVIFYATYVQEPLKMYNGGKQKNIFASLTGTFGLLAIITDIALTHAKVGFYIRPDDTVHNIHGNVYMVSIILLYSVIIFSVIRARKGITSRILVGLLGTTGISILMVIVQNFFGHTYFTSVAVFIPIISVTMLFHTGTYNIVTGMAGGDVFYSELQNVIRNKNTCFVFACYSNNFYQLMKLSDDFKNSYKNFYINVIRNGLICQIDPKRIVMLYRKQKKEDFDSITEHILSAFHESFDHTQLDYRLFAFEVSPKITLASDYRELLRFIENRVPDNSAHKITDVEIDEFIRRQYIQSQLSDMSMKKDLNDPRVIVYCQPVLNISTQKYDTAEILMRLRLEKYGLIYPDQFIPVAEDNGLIHELTMTILNKACKQIRTFLDKGIEIKRISVNFSIYDFNKENLCDEVMQIIENNNIPFNKIAIEITESNITRNFDKLKPRLMFLHEQGMKFYLDDFGTGYSNFERIMELPFNIIKFDRSLTIESKKNDNNYYMIKTFSTMFRTLEYDVLFEGVEDESDELSCIDMKATYLQGYKYSKPIPFDEYDNFLKRKVSNG